MKRNNFSDKLSIAEVFLLFFLFICYIGTLYFIITNNQPFLILFFVLHSCLSIIFVLIVHDKMIRQALQQNDSISHQLDDEIQLLSKYRDEIATLKKEQDALLAEKEQLSAKYSEAEKRSAALADSLEQQKKCHGTLQETTNLNHLLPQNENPENLDIIAVANKVVEEMTPFSRQSGIQISISSASDTLIIRADASFIRILFRNIIDNSIKYMKRNGSLVITISNIGDDLFIVLKDNGEGLPANETTRIFELNYQGSNRVSGNGLGLTQAKAIVEYYGGTIYAKSESNRGMGIYIQLPANSR